MRSRQARLTSSLRRPHDLQGSVRPCRAQLQARPPRLRHRDHLHHLSSVPSALARSTTFPRRARTDTFMRSSPVPLAAPFAVRSRDRPPASECRRPRRGARPRARAEASPLLKLEAVHPVHEHVCVERSHRASRREETGTQGTSACDYGKRTPC
jgi:hypothetical protein